MARWLPLLLGICPVCYTFAGCGVDQPAPVAQPVAVVASAVAPAAPPAAPPPTPGRLIPGPDVTLMPDGSAVLAPRVGDVAMLRRMPDGTFRRACGAPEADMRDMIQAKMRARRGAK